MPCSLLKGRGVFVKTVFSAFERFDSAPVKWMRGPCHLFVKSCLQLVNGSGGSPDSVGIFVFSPVTPGQHVRAERQSGIKEAGPLKFSIRRWAKREMWPF